MRSSAVQWVENLLTEIHGNHYHANSSINPHEPGETHILTISSDQVDLLCLVGLAGLFQALAKDDSLRRHPPSKCHPGIRLDIIETIKRWITNTTELR